MIHDAWDLGDCDCTEARLLRELVQLLDTPDGMLDRLASSLAAWKLRTMSHDLSAAGDWSRSYLPWAKRQEYDTEPRTAADIRSEVNGSWLAFYRRQSTEHLTACLEAASDTSTHAAIIRAVLLERDTGEAG